ncbi:hypothetical protein SmJEL517_g03511 [Synchytrium microbalum]|uniref:Tryptophan synthase beta chain-like PALP domain-containing protein n=1 Tax=Synchytrium microbalum TaxID=1806994 RepID=A0A507C1P8_9FUNG|nr:uncharacterized protein SmJEL517_g03511 [Synchytrium microbalum]TPX33632.1 hypothetical protein SmJEL517_g03511 [Synchytrium microbalum]
MLDVSASFNLQPETLGQPEILLKMAYAATLQDCLNAQERLKGIANVTPVLTSSTLSSIAECNLLFKCENFQKVGAFKFRGLYNAVALIGNDIGNKGVVTHSSGNAAQALALAAKMKGIPATIVMPRTAPAVKKQAVKGYGATVIECEPILSARESTTAEVQKRTGATLVHPYNDAGVIAGNGTLALEFIKQAKDMGVPLDAIVVPIGGGGMISGICIAAKGLDPNLRIIGAEPKGADDAYRSMQAGQLIPQTAPNTIADGLLTSLGSLTYPIIRDHVDEIITVEETEIVQAMKLVFERMKLVIEPSAAVGVAVVLYRPEFRRLGVKNVGVVLCGGNLDLDLPLPWVGKL